MSQAGGNLQNLNPIVVPDPVGLLPLAPGWKALLVLLLLAALVSRRRPECASGRPTRFDAFGLGARHLGGLTRCDFWGRLRSRNRVRLFVVRVDLC